MRKILFALFSLLLCAGVFWAAYLTTDHYFRIQKIPYPFEMFGIMAGLGSAAWAFGIVTFVRNRFRGQKTHQQKILTRELKEV